MYMTAVRSPLYYLPVPHQERCKLKVWREMKTGRIDVPDIFRLGFKLARRGGVPLNRDGEVR